MYFFPQDDRFNCEIDTLTGYRTKALLCMPIKDSSGDVIGVAQVINKLNGEYFSETDEKVKKLLSLSHALYLLILFLKHNFFIFIFNLFFESWSIFSFFFISCVII